MGLGHVFFTAELGLEGGTEQTARYYGVALYGQVRCISTCACIAWCFVVGVALCEQE